MLVVRPSEPFLTEDVAAAAAEEMVQVIFFKKAIFIRSDAKGINHVTYSTTHQRSVEVQFGRYKKKYFVGVIYGQKSLMC